MSVLPTLMMYTTCVPGAHNRPEEGVESSGDEVTEDCKPPCGCWESKPRPVQEPQGL